MDFINKTYKNRLTGDSFTIIDQYQNVAITSNKEKINTVLLQNDKLFIETSASISPPKSINESRTFQKSEDLVDPTKFFDNQITYDAFAQSIKNVDLSKFKDDNSNQDSNYSTNNTLPVSNESAIIMSDPEDEIEELKRKYGATTIDDSVRRQNEFFSKILDPQQQEEPQENNNNVQQIEASRREYVEPDQPYIEPPIQRIDVQDPIISMFKNVKRNLDFKINLKVDGKIPRLDFIEMMEDSYEISIIEFLADEFTEKLLNDPSIIRNQIINEIKSMIDKKNGVTKAEVRKIPEVKKEDREFLNEGLPTPVKSRRKPAVKKPTPPPSQIIPEGKDPIEPKNMNVQ